METPEEGGKIFTHVGPCGVAFQVARGSQALLGSNRQRLGGKHSGPKIHIGGLWMLGDHCIKTWSVTRSIRSQ
eukprot:8604646-Karenia_brevis.AAC.1